MGLIRIFLASSVVIWHAGGFKGWYPFNGSACVLLFFIVSGFYMALILNEKYIGPGGNFIFWKNRFFRLWPTFLVATILTIPLKPAVLENIFDLRKSFSILATLAPNFTMVGYEIYDLMGLDKWGNFSLRRSENWVALTDYALLPQAWSLGLEIWFYLLAPFAVRSISRTFFWLLASAAILLWSRMVGMEQWWQYRSFPPVLLFFMLGVVSYHFWTFLPAKYTSTYRTVGIVSMPIVLFLVVFPDVLLVVLAEQNHNKVFVVIFTLFIPAWFMWSKGKVWDRIVGETSYPVYMIHLVVMAWLVILLGPTEWLAPLSVLGSFLAGLALFVLVERPVDRWRQRAVVKIGGGRPNGMTSRL